MSHIFIASAISANYRRCGWGLLLWLCVHPVLALDDLHLQMRQLQAEDWALADLAVDVDLIDDQTASAKASVKTLVLGDDKLSGVALQCPMVRVGDSSVSSCDEGSLGIEHSLFGQIKGKLSWRYETPQQWLLQLQALKFSGAILTVNVQAEDEKIVVSFKLRGLALQSIKRFFPAGWDFSGKLNAQGELVLQDMKPGGLKGRVDLLGFSYTNDEGLQVGEDILARLRINLKNTRDSLRGNLSVKVRQGQIYSDPFFIEVKKEQPLSVALLGTLDAAGQHLQIQSAELNAGSLLSAQGTMQLDIQKMQLQKLNMSYSATKMNWLYTTIVQPLLIGTAMDDMTVTGRAQGKLQMNKGKLASLSMKLKNLDLEHNAGLFGIAGINANLHWQRTAIAKTSRLSWREGHVYKIGFQALDAAFDASGGKVSLKPLILPLLGGRLKLDKLDVDGLLTSNASWQTQAELQSLKLEALSSALDWPLLKGSLQAKIPRLYFEDSRLRMDGELQVKVFGGEVVIEGLQLEDALGVAPVLETSVRLRNLDLEQITQVLDFGRIEGTLEGYVHNMRMVAWEVTAFDTKLQSPAKDKRKHRISQRAIDNLTELGNGASANLSATMLGIFDDFAYRQLALKVRLRGAVAELDGVPAPQGGYYIVQGARLPRIDVIGRNHQVAWKDLLSRIRDIRFDDMIVE